MLDSRGESGMIETIRSEAVAKRMPEHGLNLSELPPVRGDLTKRRFSCAEVALGKPDERRRCCFLETPVVAFWQHARGRTQRRGWHVGCDQHLNRKNVAA